VKRTIFLAFACALLIFSLLGCGASNRLQSIQLSTSAASESPLGTLDVKGVGGTLQLYTWGNYSNGKTLLLSNRNVTYQISTTSGSVAWTGVLGDPNATPPQTLQLSPNGLVTAVSPFACTYINTAVPPATQPAWAVAGSYEVTAKYQGLTSPAAFVVVASEAGIADVTNPTGQCGP
jgi:hypothetical protein